MTTKDRIGHRYGRLEVMARAENDRHGNAKWLCRCDCGKEKIVNGPELNSGETQSCGCLRRDVKLGAKNPMWGGGRTMVQGYVQVKEPAHPRANNQGYVFEHTIVMERILGRPLTRAEVVHHRNGIRSDNSPDNLSLFRNVNEHTAYHKRGSGAEVRL